MSFHLALLGLLGLVMLVIPVRQFLPSPRELVRLQAAKLEPVA
jgi:hypothetical protein